MDHFEGHNFNRKGSPMMALKEVSKQVGDCASIVFTFQCMLSWFDKLKFASCTVRKILHLAPWFEPSTPSCNHCTAW